MYSKEEINTIVDELQEQITNNKNNIENLSGTVQENQNKLGTIESAVSTNQTEIANMKEQLSNIQNTMDDLASRSQLEDLSSIINKQQASIDAINSNLNLSSLRTYVEETQIFIKTQWSFLGGFGGGGSRQSVFIFGNANGLIIQGVFYIDANGDVMWDGVGNLSFSKGETLGEIVITLLRYAYDNFSLISPWYIASV